MNQFMEYINSKSFFELFWNFGIILVFTYFFGYSVGKFIAHFLNK